MRTTTFTFLDYLPDLCAEAPKRRAAEFVGLGVLAALVAACAALVTWSVADPSLNHATSTPIHNLLGRPGAVLADVAMQFFGLACVVALIPPAHLGLAPDRRKAPRPHPQQAHSVGRRLGSGGRLRLDAADSGELAAADRARRRRRRRGACGRRAGCSPAGRSARPPSAWRSPPARFCRSPPPPATTSSRAAERRIRAGGRRRRAAARAGALRQRRRGQRRRAGFRPRLARRPHPHRADDQERAQAAVVPQGPLARPRPGGARALARPRARRLRRRPFRLRAARRAHRADADPRRRARRSTPRRASSRRPAR